MKELHPQHMGEQELSEGARMEALAELRAVQSRRRIRERYP